MHPYSQVSHTKFFLMTYNGPVVSDLMASSHNIKPVEHFAQLSIPVEQSAQF